MLIRLGHYYFDNKPLIGKIVDFHAWNRLKTHFIAFCRIAFMTLEDA